MKTLFTIFLVSLMTLTSQAQLPQQNDANSVATNKSFELLAKKIEEGSIVLAGDVKAKDDLKNIFDDVGAYMWNMFGGIFGTNDDDDEKETTTVADLSYSCKASKINIYLKSCEMNITHKSGEKTKLKFEVIFDIPGSNATAILQNTVNISR